VVGRRVLPVGTKAIADAVEAFEQDSGKQVELVLVSQEGKPGKTEAAIEAGTPPDVAFACVVEGNRLPRRSERPSILLISDREAGSAKLA
jgi:hypothetical protein